MPQFYQRVTDNPHDSAVLRMPSERPPHRLPRKSPRPSAPITNAMGRERYYCAFFLNTFHGIEEITEERSALSGGVALGAAGRGCPPWVPAPTRPGRHSPLRLPPHQVCDHQRNTRHAHTGALRARLCQRHLALPAIALTVHQAAVGAVRGRSTTRTRQIFVNLSAQRMRHAATALTVAALRAMLTWQERQRLIHSLITQCTSGFLCEYSNPHLPATMTIRIGSRNSTPHRQPPEDHTPAGIQQPRGA